LDDRNIRPVAVGGDHSVTYPILKALGHKAPLSVIHIDSHLDLADDIGGSRLHHGGPFRLAAKEGLVDPQRTVHIAIRDPFLPLETYGRDAGMPIIDINRFYDLGVDAVAAEARRIVGDTPVYISFDIDALDPAYAPGTGTPVVGGITSYEAKRLLHGLRGLNVVGADLVEVSPPFDSAGITALAGAQILFELLCLVALNLVR
jgi:guanidinopropionase